MSWDQIRDQPGAVRLLRRAIEADALAPAYLFVGPSGVGKALTARAFAQALNCEQGPGAACGACTACRTIASGNHPDIFWARPEKRSRTISVETARECIRAMGLAPQLGRHRLAVFDEADCLNAAAQNALLKTLEEPSRRSLAVLVTAEPERLLPTVRSRCQVIRFRPLDPATVAELLEHTGVAAPAAAVAAAAGEGSVARARVLADADRIGYIRDRLDRALGGDPAGAAADHAADLDTQEKTLEKEAGELDVDPEALTREQLARLREQQVARVRREMSERIETDVRLIALALRDAVAAQAAGDPSLCTLGRPLPALARAEPAALAIALDEVDRGLTYLRQYIKPNRVLFHIYTAVERAAEPVAP